MFRSLIFLPANCMREMETAPVYFESKLPATVFGIISINRGVVCVVGGLRPPTTPFFEKIRLLHFRADTGMIGATIREQLDKYLHEMFRPHIQ
jgi:hypothetical protein